MAGCRRIGLRWLDNLAAEDEKGGMRAWAAVGRGGFWKVVLLGGEGVGEKPQELHRVKPSGPMGVIGQTCGSLRSGVGELAVVTSRVRL